MTYVTGSFRLQVVVRFVDVGGIVDHHTLNCFFSQNGSYLLDVLSEIANN